MVVWAQTPTKASEHRYELGLVALLGTVHAVCARSAAISFPNFLLRAWCLKLELRLNSILELR